MRVAESALVVVQLTTVENPNGDVVVANQQACETSVHGETGVVTPTQRTRNTDSGCKQRGRPESLVSEQRDSAYRIGNKSCTRIPSPNFSASVSACSFSTPNITVIVIIIVIVPFSRVLFPCGASPVPLFSLVNLSIVRAVSRIMPPHTRSKANTPRPTTATPSRIPTTPENPAEPVNVSPNPTTPVSAGPAAYSDMTPNVPPSDGISPNLATNPAELPSVPRKRVPSNPLAAAAAASSSRFPDRADPPGRVALQSAEGSRHQVILPSNFVPGNRPGTFKDLDAPQQRTSLPGGHLDHGARRTIRQATERQWTAPMPLNEYMTLPRFDAGRYAAIPANHTVQVAGVCVSARSEAWRRRWLHCRHIQDVHDPCDLEFLRTSHEGLYQARLASLFHSISERGWQEDSIPKTPHIELLCYGREAFHGIYWTKNRKVFGEDASSESRIRHRWLRPRYDWPCPTMFTWDATGSYFKVPFDLRFQYYPQGFPA